MITQDRLKELLHYDPEIGIFTQRLRRPRVRVGDIAGYSESSGYWRIHVDGRKYLAHRLAWLYVTGEWPIFVDHEDLDKSNNRFGNLRKATRSQNGINRSRFPNNTSGFKGVSFCKRTRNYMARIQVNGSSLFLGCFNKAEEAHAAYVAAAEKYFGEFARAA